ncbi:MAG: hypothetical protein H8D45_21985 [Bacteroidetes bacterium]|nr:hypothetical protein [Bacteroidota bacterium]MBL7103296.1 hypothetical protein [Bacteroidales bacterium]
MFESKSRYFKLETYEVTDRRGRAVKVVPVPPPPNDTMLGIHKLKQGQRLDHLAQKYLGDPAGFWRISEINNVMLPESLTEAQEIIIPVKKF